MEKLPIARRITHWRKFAGLKQADIAKAVGVSPSAVSLWESGGNAPTLENVEAIAAACGVELRVFFGPVVLNDAAAPPGAE